MSNHKTSFTAFNIVLAMHSFAASPRWGRYVPPAAVPLLEAFRRHAADTWCKKLAVLLPAGLQLWLTDHLLVRGMAVHFLARKRWIEQAARAAIAKGVGQFVVVGAGYDTLALRLSAEFPATRWFELDLPGTQAEKRASGIAVPPGLSFCPCDLSKAPVDEVLMSLPGFEPGQKTFYVIEGVLMYVPEAAVAEFFRRIAALGPAEAAFGALAKPDAEAAGTMQRLVAQLLGKGGEGIGWTCPREGMEAFLSAAGFKLESAITYREMQREYRRPDELNSVPEEDENYYLATSETCDPRS